MARMTCHQWIPAVTGLHTRTPLKSSFLSTNHPLNRCISSFFTNNGRRCFSSSSSSSSSSQKITMSLRAGIMGLPNVGKSTLFNAVVENGKAQAANHPFCTIEPNVGYVAVPDPLLQVLSNLSKYQKTVPASVEFVDMAGFVKGASQGEGLGNKFLSHIREVDSILQNLLQYCARNRLVAEGKACHGQLVRAAVWVDTLTNNMLINMYCKCGLTEIARKVFDMMSERSLVSWNTMIGAYTQNGCQDEALSLFVEMQREQHYHPLSEFTLSSVLCACAAKSAIYECKQLHAFAVKKALDSNVYVGTALVDVYSKCNLMREALCIFEGLEDKSDVTWSSMVAGYVRNELYWGALRLYSRGQDVGLKQNQFTLSCLLSACAGLAALFQGNQLHCVLQKTGFSSSIYVSSALIDMYAKCGGIKEAYQVFSDEENKTIVSWNTMISGFSRHGRCLQVMILFEKMQQKGVFPNEVTYLSVLSACGHMGLVEEGRKYFDLMVAEKHCSSQNVLHYSCLVDILSRAGLIYDAYDVIRTMPFEAKASMWGSLLGACKVAGNVELGEIAANHLFEIEPINAGNHVLLSNIYARNKKWEEVAKTRQVLKESEAIKERGRSWIESKHEVHIFMAGEMEHPQTLEIYSKLEEVMEETEKLGYKVEIGEDAHDVEESMKVVLLRHHSEKLALAFGLITLPSGVPIRIIKNLRICGDCHTFMKYASKTTNREIVVRDVNRFHHFAAGYCSCGDFW